mmetsp:Transcript_19140/g.40213  ORF Transcript_19140/g.40213 Transcript_19140/m.40213 type:complete len:317 (-) Transcript_19140:448-1398(-)
MDERRRRRQSQSRFLVGHWRNRSSRYHQAHSTLQGPLDDPYEKGGYGRIRRSFFHRREIVRSRVECRHTHGPGAGVSEFDFVISAFLPGFEPGISTSQRFGKGCKQQLRSQAIFGRSRERSSQGGKLSTHHQRHSQPRKSRHHIQGISILSQKQHQRNETHQTRNHRHMVDRPRRRIAPPPTVPPLQTRGMELPTPRGIQHEKATLPTKTQTGGSHPSPLRRHHHFPRKSRKVTRGGTRPFGTRPNTSRGRRRGLSRGYEYRRIHERSRIRRVEGGGARTTARCRSVGIVARRWNQYSSHDVGRGVLRGVIIVVWW